MLKIELNPFLLKFSYVQVDLKIAKLCVWYVYACNRMHSIFWFVVIHVASAMFHAVYRCSVCMCIGIKLRARCHEVGANFCNRIQHSFLLTQIRFGVESVNFSKKNKEFLEENFW